MRCRLRDFVVALIAGSATSLCARDVGLITIKGPIGPATANYIARAVDVSAARNDDCLIIELDTPGGLLDATKDIVQKLYAAKTPTVVYVAPSGASAASAGCFITLAADVAAMAPNTSIGAAHPVSLGIGGAEKTDDVMKQKLENFASTYIETIANKRGRNVEWAKAAVVKSESITAEKALELKVIDLVAKDMDELLERLDGRQINGKTLKAAGSKVTLIPMVASEKLFQVLWRPEVMLLLMLIAVYGIIGELSTPGAILPGVAGGIALILALYMAAILPINAAGLALIGLAIVLFLIDIFAPTHGVLTFGGIISFFLGAMMLFDRAGPGFRLSLAYVIPATFVTAAFFVFIVAAGLRAQFLPVRVGRETMVGKTVSALTNIVRNGGGTVFVEGEYWKAVSEVPIAAGEPVEIVGIEGLILRVQPKQSQKQ
jgi:membrane-bound serine protease (ClpP class)